MQILQFNLIDEIFFYYRSGKEVEVSFDKSLVAVFKLYPKRDNNEQLVSS